MPVVIIHSEILNQSQFERIGNAFSGVLVQRSSHHRVRVEIAPAPGTINELREGLRLDINVLPDDFAPDRVRLVISDMDSTLINIECIDEIADFAGLKPRVAAITESAMRGEIDFPTSLCQRVALLKGIELGALEEVYRNRLRLNPGAEILISGLKSRSVRFALVSGGFTFFTGRLQARLGIDYVRANTLAIKDNYLLGTVEGEIVGAEAKREFLASLCRELNIGPDQCIAIGDGANDLPMLQFAGLGVAYHAKPMVQAQADVVINHKGLDAILDLLDDA
jgi:phosphoserine phosphatase